MSDGFNTSLTLTSQHLDLALYTCPVSGATGFTGRLVCEYLGKQYTANPQAPKVRDEQLRRSCVFGLQRQMFLGRVAYATARS